jgi:hypothetical protein
MAWRQTGCSKDFLERSLGLGGDSDLDRTPEKSDLQVGQSSGGSLELAAFEVRTSEPHIFDQVRTLLAR